MSDTHSDAEEHHLTGKVIPDGSDETQEKTSPEPVAAIALTVAYDGARFAGFASQPGLETVQGRLESVLSVVLRRPVVTVGAGRTDSGVHALGQVVSFSAQEADLEKHDLLRSVNALARPGLVVKEVRHAHRGFSARFDAVSREYRYRIVSGTVPPMFLSPVSWWIKKELDLDAMRRAAAVLVGEHDFRSFCVTASAIGKRTVRRVDTIDISEEMQLGEKCIVIRVVGNAFLHSMVRTVIGTLSLVGTGKKSVEWAGDALTACDRACAGPTAPAEGLTFWSVEYPEAVWR
jgi:tRNA pseudouridine38-40 synthase